MAASTAKSTGMNLDLVQTLAHHDAEITALGNRMGGVETMLHDVKSDVGKGFAALADRFVVLTDRINSFESTKGPGLGSILGFIATGGVVIAMSAGAITVLVTSFVSPPITRLEGQVASLRYYVDRREELDRNDLIELRRNRDKSVNEDIASLGKIIRQIETRAAAQLRGSATN